MADLDNNITIFAKTNFRNAEKVFGIKRNDRRRHMYVIGKTGMGKTVMLENMIISDIINGDGCCYIDPHGDTAEKLLNYIPSNRVNDVIYVNPADMEHPIAFNILESVDEGSKHLVASGLVGVFKKQFAESWGPRLEYILRNAILALLDYPGSTLLGIMRILVDKAYRKKVVAKIKDPVVKSFWTNEYTQWNDRVLQEVISPIQNKVGQFLSNMLIRNIVGQVKSTIDLRKIIDNKKILILNLSKGRIGEDTMQLLGSMIVTKLYLASMSRVDIPEEDRKDFYLYVDEFQNFATDSFANILSEARKYRLNLIIAHQYIEQLPELVAGAVFGNVGTLACFRIGAVDALQLVNEYAPVFTEEDLVNLPAYNIYLRLMIDGVVSDPFSATTLPPLYDNLITDNSDKIIKVSRERYANDRWIVEDKIHRWSGTDLSDQMVKAVGGREGDRNDRDRERKRPEAVVKSERRSEDRPPVRSVRDGDRKKKMEVPIVCAACGKQTTVNFKPDPSRPVFCKDCLEKGLVEVREVKEERVEAKPVVAVKNPVIEVKEKIIEKKAEPEIIKSEMPALSLSQALSAPPVSISHVPRRSNMNPPRSPESRPHERRPSGPAVSHKVHENKKPTEPQKTSQPEREKNSRPNNQQQKFSNKDQSQLPKHNPTPSDSGHRPSQQAKKSDHGALQSGQVVKID